MYIPNRIIASECLTKLGSKDVKTTVNDIFDEDTLISNETCKVIENKNFIVTVLPGYGEESGSFYGLTPMASCVGNRIFVSLRRDEDNIELKVKIKLVDFFRYSIKYGLTNNTLNGTYRIYFDFTGSGRNSEKYYSIIYESDEDRFLDLAESYNKFKEEKKTKILIPGHKYVISTNKIEFIYLGEVGKYLTSGNYLTSEDKNYYQLRRRLILGDQFSISDSDENLLVILTSDMYSNYYNPSYIDIYKKGSNIKEVTNDLFEKLVYNEEKDDLGDFLKFVSKKGMGLHILKGKKNAVDLGEYFTGGEKFQILDTIGSIVNEYLTKNETTFNESSDKSIGWLIDITPSILLKEDKYKTIYLDYLLRLVTKNFKDNWNTKIKSYYYGQDKLFADLHKFAEAKPLVTKSFNKCFIDFYRNNQNNYYTNKFLKVLDLDIFSSFRDSYIDKFRININEIIKVDLFN